MKARKALVAVAAVLLVAVSVRADMASAPCRQPTQSDLSLRERPDAGSQARSVDRSPDPDRWTSSDASLDGALLQAPLAASLPSGQGPQLKNLPAAPSSVSLFLSALGGLGAWQLGRSTKRLHLGAVPEWYHSGGPAQIGHVSAIDPDLSSPAVLAHFDQLPEERPLKYLLRRTVSLHLKSQFTRALVAPRPPPA